MNTNISIDPVAEKRLNKTIDDMEKKIKSLNRELEMSAGIIAAKESEIAGLKERVREMGEGQTPDKNNKRLLQYAERMNMMAQSDPPQQIIKSEQVEKNTKKRAGLGEDHI
jgi:septal ring factor EnvC (AmiA/AmiB activator)